MKELTLKIGSNLFGAQEKNEPKNFGVAKLSRQCTSGDFVEKRASKIWASKKINKKSRKQPVRTFGRNN